MQIVTRALTKAGSLEFPLNGSEGFGFDAETVITVTASGGGIRAVIWPTGTLSISNMSNADRIIDVTVDEAPLAPSGMTLQAGFYAVISTTHIRVYNNLGELQTGYTSQNAA